MFRQKGICDLGNFVRHEVCDKCGSSDGKAIYEENGMLSHYCWVCNDASLSAEYKQELQSKRGANKPRKTIEREKIDMEVKVSTKPIVSDEENQEIKSKTTIQANGFRSIRDDIYKMFGVRHTVKDGEVSEQFYPVTQEGQLSGYKIREVPKNFRSKGRTGADCELFMQFKFNRGGKYVCITEGEIDSLSAYQMLNDYNKSKQSDFETAVVSPTTGANSKKQIAAQYKFLDSFENIILMYDNDKAGKEASEELIKYLPKGKVKVATLRYKDPNEYLENDKQKEFVSDFYNAKTFVPVGVVGSGSISSAMREEFNVPKIPLPPFMHKLQDLMAGGVPLGRIINIGAASGIGKSSIVDEIVYHMIFNSPHKVGVVTLESTAGQYGNKLLSRHIGRKLELEDNEKALSIMNSEEVLAKERELFWTTEGDHRFYLVDDRDGGADNVKDAIENLIISCGCKAIVLDPTNDVIGTLPNEEQESFYGWMKGMVKSHNVTFYNVLHTRKTSQGQQSGSQGANLSEEDLMGSSSAYKSAACNLMFSRNKEAEDPVERNTTTMKMTKCRWTGKTGIVGKYYYDNNSSRMYDLDEWLNGNM